jgi:NADPH:quinone reductase-like Zn-dependent oxidoreductase
LIKWNYFFKEVKMKYKSVIVPQGGGPEVLKIMEMELLEPRAGEDRLKVLASGVSPGDAVRRKFQCKQERFTLLEKKPFI